MDSDAVRRIAALVVSREERLRALFEESALGVAVVRCQRRGRSSWGVDPSRPAARRELE